MLYEYTYNQLTDVVGPQSTYLEHRREFFLPPFLFFVHKYLHPLAFFPHSTFFFVI